MMNSLFGKDNWFYHGSIRKYTVLFGSVFEGLHVRRADGKGREEFVAVPIRYASGNRYEKLAQDAAGREVNKTRESVPAIAYRLQSFAIDEIRKGNPNIRLGAIAPDSPSGTGTQYNRVPYNFTYELSIRTKTLGEMMQCAEQIIPAFNSKVSVRIQDSEDIGADQDIVIGLDDVQMDDNWEQDDDPHYIEWTFLFTLKGYLYQRTKTVPLVREVSVLTTIGESYFDGQKVELVNEKFKSPIEPDLLNVIDKTTAVEGLVGKFNDDTLKSAIGAARKDHRKGKL